MIVTPVKPTTISLLFALLSLAALFRSSEALRSDLPSRSVPTTTTAIDNTRTRTTTSSTSATMSSNLAANAARRSLSLGRLKPESTVFLLCDIQERFRPLMWRGETVVRTANYLTSVAKALDIPVVITQQYTKVFGETVGDCFADPDHFASCPRFDKKKFSMCTDAVREHLDGPNNGRDSVVLFGIEAHVCVQQTCLDLLEAGKDVHLIADGISSQQAFDREIALQRMTAAGAFLTTAQSAAFMLMRSADHPDFKTVSKLTVNHMKLPNEFNDALTAAAAASDADDDNNNKRKQDE